MDGSRRGLPLARLRACRLYLRTIVLMNDRDVRAQEPDLEVSQSNLCILENRLHARSLTAGDQRREEPLRWDQLSVRNVVVS